MANHQLLDNITHKDLHIITEHGVEYGDNTSYGHVFVAEFQDVQAHYPIFFQKNSNTGHFEAIALFGLGNEENLFVNDRGWQANYIPISIKKRPFLIGFQETVNNGVVSQDPVVHIDMDSPRISYNQGEPIFLEQGSQSPYLQQITSTLVAVNQGHEETKTFIETLLQYDLLEAVEIKIALDDDSKHNMDFLYTINEEKLATLADGVILTLHKNGYLKSINMVLASMSNMSDLIERKNNRIKSAL
jgi:hypothetical protein